MATQRTLKPRKQPLQERSRATVEAILEAAAQVFERHGYAAGTTNRIAERAGVSIGSLYEYFPSKDAIVIELGRRHIEDTGRTAWPTLAQLTEGPTPLREGLEAIVWGFFALHERRRGLQQVMFEQAPRSEEIQSMRAALFERASDAIGDYLRRCPEVTVADHALAGRMVAQTVEATTHGLALHEDKPEQFARLAEETIVMLERYLTARGPHVSARRGE
jgi:AcrR family transcriptional regulator